MSVERLRFFKNVVLKTAGGAYYGLSVIGRTILYVKIQSRRPRQDSARSGNTLRRSWKAPSTECNLTMEV